MKPLSSTMQTGLLIALMILMVATRFHHLGSLLHLPDASMAVFFIGGLLLRRYALYALLLGLAVAVDWLAIHQQGMDFFQHYCVTPAYWALWLSYLVLWGGGRLASRWLQPQPARLAAVLLIGVAAAALSFLISNGAFYWWGGRYPQPHWTEYVQRLWQWGPLFVRTTSTYVAVGLLGYWALARRSGRAARVSAQA